MKRKHRIRSILWSLLIPAIFIVCLAWLTYAQVRQERLNRALIAAIKRYDAPAVVSLLQQGADANARDLPTTGVSIWQLLLDRLRGRPANSPKDQFLTALMVLLDD